MPAGKDAQRPCSVPRILHRAARAWITCVADWLIVHEVPLQNVDEMRRLRVVCIVVAGIEVDDADV